MSLDPTTRAALLTGSATILSVLGALGGVFGNLWWNRKQHRDEKSMTLRRDVYLDAINAINKASTFLTTTLLPVKPPQENESTIASELSGICAKLHILGSKRLVSAVIEFQSLFTSWHTRIKSHNELKPELDRREREMRQKHREVQNCRCQCDETKGCSIAVSWRIKARGRRRST